MEDIPKEYPKVLDQQLYGGRETSENYYPNWSRTAFMDVRNVNGLYLSDVQFTSMEKDEREAYIIENSRVLRQDIFVEEDMLCRSCA